MQQASNPLYAASLPLRFKNLLASAAVVLFGCLACALAPYNVAVIYPRHSLLGQSFSGGGFLMAAALAYTAMLGLHFLTQPHPETSKSLRFFLVLEAFARSPTARLKARLSDDERVAVLGTLLKAYFGPMMVTSLLAFAMGALANGAAIVSAGVSTGGLWHLFNQHGHWFLLQLILLVDVSIFTIGYLVELPQLNNRINSVDPTLLGWAATLLCYPPLNSISNRLLGGEVSEFPQFENVTVHLVMNLVLLLLMAIYASASIALGFKASNLTHRGIVDRGPYAFVRHPAYTAKNLAWWIGSIPLVTEAFGRSSAAGALAVASVVGWTMLYALRAITEEDHLRRVDGGYAAYARKVRYRFIPRLI